MNGRRLAGSAELAPRRSTEWVPLSELTHGDSPRLSGADGEHVRLLAESDSELPPILVNRRTMSVVDGMHRVRAAELRGQKEIEAVFCECDDEEAFVLAVRENISHGLPLPRSDRNAAAERIIGSHPDWSDRAIASVTGLSHKTVGSIRRRASGEIPHSHTRIGRDGRERPVDATEGRVQAGRLLAERPGVSLREVAREAGISPATVRDVRDRLRRGDSPVGPVRRGPGEAAPGPAPAVTGTLPRPGAVARIGGGTDGDLAVLIHNLRKDPSLRFSESGRTLLRFLDVCTVDPQEWTRISENVPPHRTEIIATAARACSRAWREFARELEQRSGRQASG